MLNTQRAHDQIVRYFTRPGARLSRLTDEQKEYFFLSGTNKPTSCWYRHPEDPTVMCGVGILIPPDMYSKSFEGRPVIGLLDWDKPLREHLCYVDHDYLVDVQRTHDKSTSVQQFLDQLRLVARKYRLVHPQYSTTEDEVAERSLVCA